MEKPVVMLAIGQIISYQCPERFHGYIEGSVHDHEHTCANDYWREEANASPR